MMTSAVCTPSWVIVMSETFLTEVPRVPATSGFRTDRQAGPSAGRSSIEVLGPAGRRRHTRAPFPLTREPLPRTGPWARWALLGRGRGTSFCLFLPVIHLPPAGRPAGGFALNLPAQAELLDQRAVAGDVLPGQVLQQPAAAADEQQQPPAAVMIMLVHLEVLGQLLDPPCQQRDLDLRRAGVTLTGRVPGDDLLLHRGL